MYYIFHTRYRIEFADNKLLQSSIKRRFQLSIEGPGVDLTRIGFGIVLKNEHSRGGDFFIGALRYPTFPNVAKQNGHAARAASPIHASSLSSCVWAGMISSSPSSAKNFLRSFIYPRFSLSSLPPPSPLLRSLF